MLESTHEFDFRFGDKTEEFFTTTNAYAFAELAIEIPSFLIGIFGNLLVIYVQKISKRKTGTRRFLQLNAIGSIM